MEAQQWKINPKIEVARSIASNAINLAPSLLIKPACLSVCSARLLDGWMVGCLGRLDGWMNDWMAEGACLSGGRPNL